MSTDRASLHPRTSSALDDSIHRIWIHLLDRFFKIQAAIGYESKQLRKIAARF